MKVVSFLIRLHRIFNGTEDSYMGDMLLMHDPGTCRCIARHWTNQQTAIGLEVDA